MTSKLIPIASFLAGQGGSQGQYIGLRLGPGLVITDEGEFLAIDAIPVAQPTTVVPGRVKDLTPGVPTPILSIDIAQTGDNSWGAKLFFNVECTDGTDVQLREGDANVGLAYKASTLTFATAQAINTTGALTGGTLVIAFSWTVAGTVATLNVTATTSLAPTELRLHFFIPFMAHDVVVYIP